MTPNALYEIRQVDAFEWLRTAGSCCIHAVVTDPPFGLVEYEPDQLEKRKNRNGGIWRLPHNYDGNQRQPVPRFTVLSSRQHARIADFFTELAGQLIRVLVPGAHVFIATQSLLSHLVYVAFISAGFEKRGEIVRVVRTLRGGDRPRKAEGRLRDVSVIPRGCWEPWGLFRKPCEGTVKANLLKWGTGGLKRVSEDEPFKDLIESSPASRQERRIAPHPTLKPQAFMRQIVEAALPLGEGTILDPFMGAGSTIAAAEALGLRSIGLEVNEEYYRLAKAAIPELAALEARPSGTGTRLRST